MMAETKSINFGQINHFLYVRINSVCADLGYNFKQFIEQAYYLLVDLITEEGETQLDLLAQKYIEYADIRKKTQYAPRMSDEKHNFVVGDIHGEVHEHLDCIKEERGFPWIVILEILLMVIEIEIDKENQRSIREMEKIEDVEIIRETFSDLRFDYNPGFSVDKKESQKKYERRQEDSYKSEVVKTDVDE